MSREWPYKNVKPRIIAEEYLEDTITHELMDFKFLCFHGEPKLMYIASNRGTDTRFNFYDIEFNLLPLKQRYPNSDKTIQKPVNFEKMIEFSRKLSKDMPHVRVDFL